MRRSLEERFWSKVEKSIGCWVWLGGKDEYGYGRFGVGAQTTLLAHRVAWILVNGEIKNGLLVLHSCDHPFCVNPSHLWLGTDQDNATDCARKGRTCKGKEKSKIMRLTAARGEHASKVVLTEAKVRSIRSRIRQDGESQRSVARAFGVSPMTVNDILNGRTWAHVG